MFIKKFSINNFRSLVDFSISEFDTTTIFYGENNVGKSNVLLALNTIFKRKRKAGEEIKQNFYEGVLEGFSNNFYGNSVDQIEFEVEVEFNPNEIVLTDEIKKFIKKRASGNIINVRGKIEKRNLQEADMITEQMKFNDIIIYNNDLKKEKISYFPTLKGTIDTGLLSDSLSYLVSPLNDCIRIISNDRDMHKVDFSYELSDELAPESFKYFLNSLYLSEEKHWIFELINEVFNDPPFSFGEISFAKTQSGELELMIKENDVRLPIKHMGSGVLQTLYIIASIIYYKHKIICIEELEQNLSPPLQNRTLRKLQSMVNNQDIGDLQQIIISSHSTVFSKPKLGFIYYLEKDADKTIVKEKIPTKSKIKKYKGIKQLLKPAALDPDTYTEAEWKENIEENIEDGKRRMRH